ASIPPFSIIRRRTQEVFNVQPCLWQMKVVEAILHRERDVLCIAGTGMGKTLTFWMPLLFRPEGIQIVVTPLNLLGKQNIVALTRAHIPAISINSETATATNFHAILKLKYRAIVISPEQMMRPDGEFEKILKDTRFASHIISIVIDEAHCLTDWGEFRPEYRELARLHYLLPSIPLLVASATLTKTALNDIMRLLQMRLGNTAVLRRSSDRPNIKIGVKKIKYALNTFADLAFLVPDDYKDGDPPLPKFLVFFDNISDSIAAANSLRKRLPTPLREKIKWFNSDMSNTFKEAEFDNLTTGKTWGLCTTTSFGMGMDIPDIALVIQWRATCNLSALWQRFGRAARSRELTGTALLFAEHEYFDEERAAKAERS
ncbi:P-loop containing nucleoside triphosphate hydrolase protein, partial [Boletus edulis BED1]